jgi:glycosyltransferase involved in cell wall biosynthesis
VIHLAPATGPVLLVASQLPARGYCGVQTHFNQLMDLARDSGIEAGLVSPHEAPAVPRRSVNLVGRATRALAGPGPAVHWQRHTQPLLQGLALHTALQRQAGRPVTVYAQDPSSAHAALRLRRRGLRFRLCAVAHFNISEAHELEANGLTERGSALWQHTLRLEREVLPQVDRLLFVSEHQAAAVRSRVPLDADHTEVIPNMVAAPPAPAPLAGGETPTDLISIGTLEPRKNQGYLLEVLAAARRLGHRYSLTLVGDGPSRAAWEARAAALGVAGQVRFMGYQPHAAARLQHHRAYVHAARMESFGIVLVEAMAAGLPVLATPVGGAAEVLRDTVEGRYWPLDDARQAALMLIDTLEDEPRRQAMGRAARQGYETRFSPAVLGQRWLAAVMGRTAPNPHGRLTT